MGEKTWPGGAEYFQMTAKTFLLQCNTMWQANYSLWTKSGPLLDMMNKVLLGHIVNKVLSKRSHTRALTYRL